MFSSPLVKSVAVIHSRCHNGGDKINVFHDDTLNQIQINSNTLKRPWKNTAKSSICANFHYDDISKHLLYDVYQWERLIYTVLHAVQSYYYIRCSSDK